MPMNSSRSATPPMMKSATGAWWGSSSEATSRPPWDTNGRMMCQIQSSISGLYAVRRARSVTITAYTRPAGAEAPTATDGPACDAHDLQPRERRTRGSNDDVEALPTGEYGLLNGASFRVRSRGGATRTTGGRHIYCDTASPFYRALLQK